MHTLRNKLILVFIVATLAPLLVTVRISVLLLQRSLNYSSALELDEISKSLEATGRELPEEPACIAGSLILRVSNGK